MRVSESSEEAIGEMEENVAEREQEIFENLKQATAQETPQLCSASEKQDDKEVKVD